MVMVLSRPIRRGLGFLSLLSAAILHSQNASCFPSFIGVQQSNAHKGQNRRGLWIATTNLVDRIELDRRSTQTFALSEIFVPNAMSDQNLQDDHLWVPQTDSVSFRPLCLSVSGGYYVNLLRVRGSGTLSRHRHPGPVHGYVLKGKWKYLEHDWVAVAGSYIFEPPGEIHTLVVPDDVDEMITLFFVTGSLLYCDEAGNVVGADDVFTKLDMASKHYSSLGLGEDYIRQFVR